MLQSGYINFFNVNKCGIYRNFGPEPKGLELIDTFSRIKAWKDSRNFEATNPWDPKVNRNKTACYCHEVYKAPDSDDFLLVLWKSDADSSAPLYGIEVNPDGSVGKTISQAKAKGNKKMVWGRPCYYWIVPELQLVASIKFENSRTDSAMFQDWVKGCVDLRLPLPEFKKTTTEKGFTRIELQDEEDKFRYHFNFDLTLKSISTASAELQDLARRVTHIVRRETVSIRTVDKRQGFARLFKRFEVPYISAEDDASRKVEIKIEAKPTVAELKEIIENYAESHESEKWENVGFVIDNTSRVVWASKFRLTDKITAEDNNKPIFNAEKLYATILHNRDRYLDPIRKELAMKNALQEAENA